MHGVHSRVTPAAPRPSASSVRQGASSSSPKHRLPPVAGLRQVMRQPHRHHPRKPRYALEGRRVGARLQLRIMSLEFRWHVYFTPASASWISQAERFFALLTDQQLRRSVYHSTADLQAAIHAYIDAHNAQPKPFRWTKSADDILAAINRFCLRTLEALTPALPRTSESGH